MLVWLSKAETWRESSHLVPREQPEDEVLDFPMGLDEFQRF